MKKIILFLLTAWSALAQNAQPHFAVLHTLDGQSLTNATITRATASFVIVDFDGGGSKIALTNFPADIQRQFGFDPVTAAAADKAEKEKQAKARAAYAEVEQAQRKLQGWTGTPLKARIVTSLPNGQYLIVDNPPKVGAWKQLPQHIVTIQNLPYDVSSFAIKITNLREETGQRVHGYGGRDQLAGASSAMLAQNAAMLKGQLQEMLPLEEYKMTIMVAPTKMQFGGVPTWRYMGLPTE